MINSAQLRAFTPDSAISQENRPRPPKNMPCDALTHKVDTLLRECTFKQLKQIHGFIITTALRQAAEVQSKFLQRCTEFGGMKYAESLFSHILNDEGPLSAHVTLWNAMVRGYAYNGPCETGFSTFVEMKRRELEPNNFTYPYVLGCCRAMGWRGLGGGVHSQVIKSGFGCAPRVSESLFDMYANMSENSCLLEGGTGNVGGAWKAFDEMWYRPVGSWNRMISLCVNAGDVESAWRLFEEMPERDVVSWNSILTAFVKIGNITRAMELFQKMPQKNVISWTLMVRSFGRSGELETARTLFETMPERNVLSWNTMISLYTQHGNFQSALDLYVKMLSSGTDPDGFTFVSALIACSHLGDLEYGRQIRSQIKDWCRFGVIVATALIDMYAKCGDVGSAFSIFLKIGKNKDVFCWNVMINSLARHGRAQDAVKLFSLMKRDGLMPNVFTFSGVLFACSHGGLVDEGERIFKDMETDFGVCPTLEHYGCLIDLLSRNGQLDKALSVVKKMPFAPDITIWGALLAGCRIKGEIKMAEEVLMKANTLMTEEAGVFASVFNLYALKDQWSKAFSTREKMEEMQMRKKAGHCSVF